MVFKYPLYSVAMPLKSLFHLYILSFYFLSCHLSVKETGSFLLECLAFCLLLASLEHGLTFLSSVLPVNWWLGLQACPDAGLTFGARMSHRQRQEPIS